MVWLELIYSIPISFIWITIVHIFGGVFPWGAITWTVIWIIWTVSVWRQKALDKMWDGMYG